MEVGLFSSNLMCNMVNTGLEVGTSAHFVSCNSVWYMVVVIVFVHPLDVDCFSCSDKESSGKCLHSGMFNLLVK